MIIKTDDTTIRLPFDNNINIVINNDRRDIVIECLISYFLNKKKNLCAIYDDDMTIVPCKDISFVYVPFGSLNMGNYIFKEKTEFSSFLSNIIENNQECFQSLENIRNSVFELVTDKGFFNFKKILLNGVASDINIEVASFNIPSILSSLKIEYEGLTESQLYLMMYNVLLYRERLSTAIIVYLDTPVTNEVRNWISSLSEKVLVIIDDESVKECLVDDASIIKIGKCNQIKEVDTDPVTMRRFLYVSNSFVRANLDMQTQENIDLYRKFDDEDITFVLKNATLDFQNYPLK